jgi:hypothetical protein
MKNSGKNQFIDNNERGKPNKSNQFINNNTQFVDNNEFGQNRKGNKSKKMSYEFKKDLGLDRFDEYKIASLVKEESRRNLQKYIRKFNAFILGYNKNNIRNALYTKFYIVNKKENILNVHKHKDNNILIRNVVDSHLTKISPKVVNFEEGSSQNFILSSFFRDGLAHEYIKSSIEKVKRARLSRIYSRGVGPFMLFNNFRSGQIPDNSDLNKKSKDSKIL